MTAGPTIVGTVSTVGSLTTPETVSITQTVTADTTNFVQFLSVAAGTQIHDIKLAVEGTTDSTAAIGDLTSQSRYLAAASTATSTILKLGAIAGLGYTYTTADTIGVTVDGASVSEKAYTLTVTFTRGYGSSKSRIRSPGQ